MKIVYYVDDAVFITGKKDDQQRKLYSMVANRFNMTIVHERSPW